MEYADREPSATNSVYSRNAYQGGKKAKGTVVPGMEEGSGSEPNRFPADSGKPIRGFLYSISRGVVGEYWPLRQGKNTIGSSPLCDVCLPEATVSESHASLTIRILESKGKTIASLKDTDSTNGTWINGQDVDFDANPCKNGDIIRFGLHYECLLLLIDTEELGLKTASEFMPMEAADDSAPIVYKETNPSQRGTVVMGGDKATDSGESRHTVVM